MVTGKIEPCIKLKLRAIHFEANSPEGMLNGGTVDEEALFNSSSFSSLCELSWKILSFIGSSVGQPTNNSCGRSITNSFKFVDVDRVAIA